VRPAPVVVLTPVLDEDLGFAQTGEQLEVEQLVAYTGMEGLNERVVLRCRLRLIGRVRSDLFV